ncbi:MAG: endonuclease/exonuclease/phosphatase family protein [Propionibacteriaceae bacterium]|jgi:endonuclease/exonuclease/phosphatase family metal-dependent hydrolase|nr:endonuclease/exonuclease/phosphatase family protein [Propionibacteriaceae bacterium]
MLKRTGKWLRRVLLVVFAAVVLVIPEAVVWVPPPVMLANLQVDARGMEAIATWQGEASEFLVLWDTDPSMAGAKSRTVTVNEITITGLEPDTVYYLAVEAVIDYKQSVDTSFRTAEIYYSMAAPPLELTPISATALRARWEDGGAETRIELQFAQGSFDGAETQTPSATAMDFTDLAKATEYRVRARYVDPVGYPLSEWKVVTGSTADYGRPLRVGSYNVRGVHTPKGNEKAWGVRVPYIAEMIRSLDIDVMGLQEAYQYKLKGRGKVTQCEDLINNIGSPYKTTISPRTKKGGNAILYNPERVTYIKGGFKRLLKARFVIWGIFEQKSTGKRFLFATAHLTTGHAAANNTQRNTQVKQIVDLLTGIAAADNLPTILVGDFNTYFGSRGGNTPYETVTKTYLDPLQPADGRGGVAAAAVKINTRYSTYNNFQRRARTTGTYMDYILVTPMRVSEWETVVNLDSKGNFIGTIPSDHNPIRATVWLP